MLGLGTKEKISSALKSNTRNRSFHNLDNMRKVLLLFTYKDWKEVEPIVQDLRSLRKDVQLWTYQTKKDEVQSLPPSARVITQKEVFPIVGLSSVVVEEFKSLSYDTLIDLTTEDDKVLFYLLASNSAEFCIGIKESEHRIFDFSLLREDSMNLEETYGQIKFYLNNMR
ncbi:MAG: hypothetical protein E6767_11810 [Dysgonomonas sp.]|nr:hypothetical protein [Dysgonomonas sp.]